MSLQHISEVLAILSVMEAALDGDGSTPYLPDVTPSQAARWIFSELDSKGYRISCPPPPLPADVEV